MLLYNIRIKVYFSTTKTHTIISWEKIYIIFKKLIFGTDALPSLSYLTFPHRIHYVYVFYMLGPESTKLRRNISYTLRFIFIYIKPYPNVNSNHMRERYANLHKINEEATKKKGKSKLERLLASAITSTS